jgi:lipocalin
MSSSGTVPNVDVTITNNQGGVDKDTARLSKAGGNQVIWTNNSQKKMQINFPAGSPFSSSQYDVPVGGNASSGTPTVPADPNKNYAYTVTPQQGGAGFDPIIIVDN